MFHTGESERVESREQRAENEQGAERIYTHKKERKETKSYITILWIKKILITY